MSFFLNSEGKSVLMKMVSAIQENKGYLGDVDGLIGDGDHGMNMNKGFTVFASRFGDRDLSFSQGLNELSMVLMNEIGGSMGPIYGTIFMDMAERVDEAGKDEIGLAEFASAVQAGLDGLCGIVDARVGDKTLVDTLSPAASSLNRDAAAGADFGEALVRMKTAAEKGRDSTRDLVAKYGRSSRLGERSRGVLDAGSCSCCILLSAMADGILPLLKGDAE